MKNERNFSFKYQNERWKLKDASTAFMDRCQVSLTQHTLIKRAKNERYSRNCNDYTFWNLQLTPCQHVATSEAWSQDMQKFVHVIKANTGDGHDRQWCLGASCMGITQVCWRTFIMCDSTGPGRELIRRRLMSPYLEIETAVAATKEDKTRGIFPLTDSLQPYTCQRITYPVRWIVCL